MLFLFVWVIAVHSAEHLCKQLHYTAELATHFNVQKHKTVLLVLYSKFDSDLLWKGGCFRFFLSASGCYWVRMDLVVFCRGLKYVVYKLMNSGGSCSGSHAEIACGQELLSLWFSLRRDCARPLRLDSSLSCDEKGRVSSPPKSPNSGSESELLAEHGWKLM